MSHKRNRKSSYKDERYGFFRNHEGYSDPTAGKAMKRLAKWKPKPRPHRC